MMTLKRQLFKGSDGHINLANLIALEPLNGFQPKLTQILPRVGHELNIMGSNVKVTETFSGEGIPIADSPSKTV